MKQRTGTQKTSVQISNKEDFFLRRMTVASMGRKLPMRVNSRTLSRASEMGASENQMVCSHV